MISASNKKVTNSKTAKLYELSQIKEILKNPRRKVEIDKAQRIESLLRVFTEPQEKREALTEKGYQDFIRFIDNTFNAERAKRIKEFFLFPLSAVDITESILNDLYKVFDAQNTFFDFQIEKNKSKKTDEVIQAINPVRWISEYGKKVLKNRPNLVVVIDKDIDGNPYLLPITSERLIDCSVNTNGTLDYVAFVHSIEKKGDEQIKRLAFYDSQSYTVVIQDGDNYVIDEEWTNTHEAGVCPARMFLSDQLNSKDCFNRRIPFSSSLSKLMEWQYFDAYKFYADHYASFPVIEKVESECEMDGCVSGFISYDSTFIENGEERTVTLQKECPSCSKKEVLGPGVLIEIPAKATKDDPDSAGVFRMISPETASLKYIGEKLDKIEANIKLKTVGIDGIISKEAINEMQAKGSFESRQNVLLKIKSNLDELYKWIVITTAKLIEGKDVEISVSANFGTEFYLLTENELQERYKFGKDAGLPAEELDLIYEQIIATKYKGNPGKLGRLEIINMIDPLPHETMDQAIKKHQIGLLTDNELFLKGRLLSLISRFELEQAPITEFGKNTEVKDRIKKIKEILNKYIDETKSIRQRSKKTGEGPTEDDPAGNPQR
ncbi:MAG TPA: hypothetical protein VFM82_12185 [Flavobacteriaceae bacterium]|nr:hypothetical protein [Flavobacteriaceae bacterium]